MKSKQKLAVGKLKSIVNLNTIIVLECFIFNKNEFIIFNIHRYELKFKYEYALFKKRIENFETTYPAYLNVIFFYNILNIKTCSLSNNLYI